MKYDINLVSVCFICVCHISTLHSRLLEATTTTAHNHDGRALIATVFAGKTGWPKPATSGLFWGASTPKLKPISISL